MGRWKVTTAPAALALSLTEVKNYLKVSGTDEDALLTTLINAAAHHAQNYLEQAIITQTITEKYDELGTSIRLSVNPVQSVSSVQYLDADGTTQTLASTEYIADEYSRRAVIEPKNSVSWPTVLNQRNAVTVVYVAGYGATEASVPADIKLALMKIVADAYDNRQDAIHEISTASKYLLDRVNYIYLL